MPPTNLHFNNQNDILKPYLNQKQNQLTVQLKHSKSP